MSQGQDIVEFARDKLIEQVVADVEGQNWTDKPLTEDEKHLVIMGAMSMFSKLISLISKS